MESSERLINHDFMTGGFERQDQGRKLGDYEGWVRFSRRSKISVGAEVHFQRAVLKPAAATASKVRRFGDFCDA
jgi:hypothetical protein